MDRRTALGLAIVVEGALLLLAFGLGAIVGAAPFALAEFGLVGSGVGVGVGVALLAALLPAMRSEWPPFARLAETVRRFVRETFADASVAELALVSAMAGIAEEALFRGVVQTALVDPLGTVPAIVVAGILFGMAHAVTLAYAVVAAGVGMALGGLLAATGDLAAPIVAHAVYDLLALVWLTRVDAPAGGPDADPDPSVPQYTGGA